MKLHISANEVFLTILWNAVRVASPSPVQIRCQLPSVPNGSFTSQGLVFFQGNFVAPETRVFLNCNNGYTVSLGRSDSKCLRNGEWTTVLGTCVKVPTTSTPQQVVLSTSPLITTTKLFAAPKKSKVAIPALLAVASTGNDSAVASLLQSGADADVADSNGWTPLMLALSKGKLTTALLLVNQADINVGQANNFGSTALHFAAKFNQSALVKDLLKKSANVNAANSYGATPLMFAARGGYSSVVKELIENKADVNAKTQFNETALMMAIASSRNIASLILLDNGADPHAKSAEGQTALALASQIGSSQLVSLLLDYGADINTKSALNIMPGNSSRQRGLLRANTTDDALPI